MSELHRAARSTARRSPTSSCVVVLRAASSRPATRRRATRSAAGCSRSASNPERVGEAARAARSCCPTRSRRSCAGSARSATSRASPPRTARCAACTIRAGDQVALYFASANRDEDVFDDPFAFRIDRRPNPHLAFGFGEHFCLGAHLARVEIETIFRHLLDAARVVRARGAGRAAESAVNGSIKRLPLRYRFGVAATSRRDTMEHRPFGRTGLEVSAVGFGCWEIGGGYGDIEADGLRPRDRPRRSTSASTASTPPRATAWARPSARSARRSAAGATRRSSSSKFGMNYRDKPNLRDSSRERVIASIDKSLKNLGTDYVDVYLVHWPDRNTPFEETMSALDDVVRDGQGPLRRPLELQARRDRGVHGGAPRRRRAVRLEHVRPAHADARSCRTARSTASASWRTARSRYGLLTGTFTEDHDFGSADWRARQGNMGAIKMFARALRSREVQGQRAGGERAEGRRRPLRQEPRRSSRCAGRRRTRP